MAHKGFGVKIPAALGTAVSAGVIIALFCVATPRSRLNVIQAGAVVALMMILVSSIRNRRPAATIKVTTATSRKAADRLWLWIPPGLAVAAFLPALSVYFLSDDFVHLAQLQLQTPLQTFWQHLTEGQAATFFRPLGFLSLALDVHLWDAWPPGFHLTSLGWHILSVTGVYTLMRLLDLRPPPAALAAAVFALLPVQVEAVVWPAARFDLLATAGIIWAGVSYLHFHRRRQPVWYLLALALGAGAMLSKENAFVLPLLILLLELLPGRHSPFRVRRVWPFAALAGLLFGYRCLVLGGIGGYSDAAGASSLCRVSSLTLLGLFIRAPAHLLTGINLRHMTAWLELVPVLLLLGITLAVAGRTVARQQPSRPLVRLGLGWMFIALVPAHALLLIGPGLCGSRVLYLSAAGWAIALAALFMQQEHRDLKRWLSVLLIGACFWGVRHNLQAWRQTGDSARAFLDTLVTVVPQPPPGTTFLLIGFPGKLNGVYLFREGLGEAISLHYDRRDLQFILADGEIGVCLPDRGSAPFIEVRWTGLRHHWVDIRPVNG